MGKLKLIATCAFDIIPCIETGNDISIDIETCTNAKLLVSCHQRQSNTSNNSNNNNSNSKNRHEKHIICKILRNNNNDKTLKINKTSHNPKAKRLKMQQLLKILKHN